MTGVAEHVEPTSTSDQLFSPIAIDHHESKDGAKASRQLWRDPIIFYGVGLPLLLLLAFFRYVVLSRLQKHEGDHVDNRVTSINKPSNPDQPAYAVTNEDGDYAKEIFHVRLPRKISVKSLRALAHDVKARHGGKRPRTIIWFCLPGRRCPQSSWAFADFEPDLRLEIRGLTMEDEKVLLAQPLPDHTELIGVWFDDALDAARYAIYRTSEGLFLSTMRFGSKTGLAQELVEKPAHASERKFERKEASRSGDRYLVGADGNFEIRDDSGTILNGNRVESGAQIARVEGTVQPDGTLEMTQKVDLPVGRGAQTPCSSTTNSARNRGSPKVAAHASGRSARQWPKTARRRQNSQRTRGAHTSWSSCAFIRNCATTGVLRENPGAQMVSVHFFESRICSNRLGK